MSEVHGWRFFTFKRCSKLDDAVVLSGQFGMHVHQVVAPRARCKGFRGGMWLTEGAKARGTSGPSNHNPDECPEFDCSCGYYGYRVYEGADNGKGPLLAVIGHVTAIGKVILHEEGFRAESYRLDFLVEPRSPNLKVPLWLTSASSPTQETVVVSGDPRGGNPQYATLANLGELQETIAAYLQVPSLPRDSLEGCRLCVVANGWKTQEEMDEIERRERFG
jgi:hypothetical protein